MTVTYSAEISTTSFFGFVKLLLRWRGSIYKAVWKDFALFALLYCGISIIYRCALDDDGKSWFNKMAKYCEKYGANVPIVFILGFYVNMVMSRFWEKMDALPWPQRMSVFVAATIHGRDEKGRMLRRTIMRYLTLAYVLSMRQICPPVRKRFPELDYITKAGLMEEEEERILEEMSRPNRKFSIHSPEFSKKDKSAAEAVKKEEEEDEAGEDVYYVPLLWAADLINQANADGRIKDSQMKMLIKELNNYRGQCATSGLLDWINVPLVYTQVVTIAVYTFFLACLLGRQHLDNHEGELYFPLFTFLEFMFYVGSLKVAECLHNPFGGDDDDFEINMLIETNLQTAFNIVDELCDFSPPLKKDKFFDTVDVDIPYTASSEEFRFTPYQGSAVEVLRKTVRDKPKAEDEEVLIYKEDAQLESEMPPVTRSRSNLDVDAERGTAAV